MSEFIGLVDQASSAFSEMPTKLGWPDCNTAAVEQAHAQLILKPGDTAAQRWLGDVEGNCRTIETAVIENGDQLPKLAKIGIDLQAASAWRSWRGCDHVVLTVLLRIVLTSLADQGQA
jgi:hypothetical protein